MQGVKFCVRPILPLVLLDGGARFPTPTSVVPNKLHASTTTTVNTAAVPASRIFRRRRVKNPLLTDIVIKRHPEYTCSCFPSSRAVVLFYLRPTTATTSFTAPSRIYHCQAVVSSPRRSRCRHRP